MVSIEIDGKVIEAKDGAMIIEAADDAGIPIPRFCYHKKLSVAANCRMCLVEVEKAAKPLPACATPITDGMKVYTKSTKAIDAQKSVMEFLLINHPLDCPICDQGGECELQDLAMGYGAGSSQFGEGKRVVKDKNIGPLISTDMTRCIHCTRCVRFGQEVAGVRELGATGRGEHMQIGTYIEKSVSSELSGNVIDLCPVGALTSKPFRFHARNWEMNNRPAIAAHDCVGSNIRIETLRDSVRRVTPAENEEINETWISDRDRFAYEGVNSEDRLTTPMIKKDGQWLSVEWADALEFTRTGLKKVLTDHGAGQLGALVSPSATLEEQYLLQKLVRGLGSSNIDHRLRQQDFAYQESMPLMPSLGGMTIVDLEKLQAALVVGGNVRLDQPMLSHRLRKAALAGGKISYINPIDYDCNMPVYQTVAVAPSAMVASLAGVAKALLESGCKAPKGVDGLLANVTADDAQRNIAASLKDADRVAVVIGQYSQSHPAASTLIALANAIAEMTNAKVAQLTEGANAAGAWLAGAVPHRAAAGKGASFGLNADTMWREKLAGYLLHGVEVEYDTAEPALAQAALKNAGFVAVMTAFSNDAMKEYADVLLPVAPHTETSGTYINVEGKWQSFGGSVKPLAETRPAWKVLRVLGNLFELDGFEYISSEEIRDELKQAANAAVDVTQAFCPETLHAAVDGLQRVADIPAYASDAIVRRAPALQSTKFADVFARLNPADASAQGVSDGQVIAVYQGEQSCEVTLAVDSRVPQGVLWLPTATKETAGFGVNVAQVSIKNAEVSAKSA